MLKVSPKSFPMDEGSSGSIQKVIVTDLDGTLCRTDTLHKALLRLAAKQPLALLSLPKWLFSGKAVFKEKVADLVILEPSTLPYNGVVLELLRKARNEGAHVALVSAADSRQVQTVADFTALFDEAHGTENKTNLKGNNKASFLIKRYGRKSFDYIGDAKADLPVWAVADLAITVGASASLRKSVESVNSNTLHIDQPGVSLNDCLMKVF